MKPKILFSNISLLSRSGSETFLWDLARGLQARGWECGIYTPRTGAFADEFRRLNIPVWRNLDEITMEPDVLHCQHTLESLALREKFPDTPALFMVHGSASWHDTTPGGRRWSALVAVDDVCKERIMRETGLSADQIHVVYNSVDTSRFLPRDPLPEAPSKAAIFTSYAVNDSHVKTVRELCARLDIALDELGPAAGRPVVEPELWLPKYDLVFGKARCALEAMATGSAVILIGAEGVGEMVTPENFSEFRKRNFGHSLLRPGMDQCFLEEQVKRYTSSGARQVQEMVRRTCCLDGMVEAFDQLYRKLSAPVQSIPVLKDAFPVTTLVTMASSILQEHASISSHLEQTIIHHNQTTGFLEQELIRTTNLLEQEQVTTQRQRERAEHYRATTKKYKTKVAVLEQKLTLGRFRKKTLWKRLRSLFGRI